VAGVKAIGKVLRRPLLTFVSTSEREMIVG